MDDDPPIKRQRRSESPGDTSFSEIVPSSQPEESRRLDVVTTETSQVDLDDREKVCEGSCDAAEMAEVSKSTANEGLSNSRTDEDTYQESKERSTPAPGPNAITGTIGLITSGNEEQVVSMEHEHNRSDEYSENHAAITSEDTNVARNDETNGTTATNPNAHIPTAEDHISRNTETDALDPFIGNAVEEGGTEADVDVDMDGEADYDDPWFDAACLTTMVADEWHTGSGIAAVGEIETISKSSQPTPPMDGHAGFGFTTGAGSAIAEPSLVARARVAALFADEDVAMDTVVSPVATEPTTSDHLFNSSSATEIVPAGFGFKTAGGGELAQPSEKARLAALAMLDTIEQRMSKDLDTTGDGPRSTTNVKPEPTLFRQSIDTTTIHPGRTGGKNATYPPPNQLAIPEAHTTSLFTTGLGRAVQGPSESARLRAAALFADDSPNTKPSAAIFKPTPFPRDRQRSVLMGTPARPGTVGGATMPDKEARIDTMIPRNSTPPPATPTPLQKISKHLLATPHRTGLSSGSRATPKSLILVNSSNLSPVPHRRVPGLGLTSRSTPVNKKKPAFSTPFKVGHVAQATPVKSKQLRGLPVDALTSKAKFSLFDLEIRPGRQDMLATQLHPLFYSAAELEAMDIPADILLIDSQNGRLHAFDCGGKAKGLVEATAELKALQCSISQTWVENHWCLILWKLASLVKARPGLLSEKWNYAEAIRQLKYRYEREYHRAHRSSVKRIQEQDSSASLPMVLCVSNIQSIREQVDSEGVKTEGGYGLELTDGWYRIRAKADAPLSRAITLGRLRVGYKVAISGARIASDKDGIEVLEALDRSHLVFSGNSCSLAHWNSRLGFVGRPFVACISSLTADGGVVPLMDIRVAKVYPVAFVPAQKGQGEPPWTLEEEHRRNDQWQETYNAERTRLVSSFERRLQTLQDDLQILRGAAGDVGQGGIDEESNDDDVDEIFDAFRLQSNKHAFLRKVKPSAVMGLLSKASEMLQEESRCGQTELELELQMTCPPRNTRSFQIIRFVDAKSFKHACSAQLQIWDIISLGHDMIKEGARYHVSNLAPAQLRSWSRPSGAECAAYLSSRRDTQWSEIGNR